MLGWQIDNEYNEASFDPATKAQFQQWVKARYGTLDNLNARWTTAYWSESYTAWDQIPIQTSYGNPGLLLSWMRFVSDTWRSYQRNQLEVIRANSDSRQFITTNMMGWFDGFDHYTVAEDLDMAAWDDYVGQGHLKPGRNGAAHDLTRGFKRKNFWVIETQPGSVNWADINNFLDKGEVRAMAWHDVGHGADAVSYWQWRSALSGQEQYHGVIVGPDGNPFLSSARSLRSERNSKRLALRWPKRRCVPRSRSSTPTTVAGPFNGRNTTRITIPWKKLSAITSPSAQLRSPSTLFPPPLHYRSTNLSSLPA